eukprot:1373344-Pleurochrysis_carterae.AAC.1
MAPLGCALPAVSLRSITQAFGAAPSPRVAVRSRLRGARGQPGAPGGELASPPLFLLLFPPLALSLPLVFSLALSPTLSLRLSLSLALSF